MLDFLSIICYHFLEVVREMEFKENIKKLRKEYGLSQEELSKRLGIARSSVANYENGQNFPNMDILVKLSEIFNCSIDYILGKSDYKNEEDFWKKHSSDIVKDINIIQKLETKGITTPKAIENIVNELLETDNSSTFNNILDSFLSSIPEQYQEKVKDYILNAINHTKMFNSKYEKIDSDKINIGLSTKDYAPPTKEQQEKIEEFARFVLKDNLKKKEDK